VVVSMGDVAASGGYYIAMGSDAIVAQPGTITGSIGVFGGKFSLRGLYEKIGLTKEILTRGQNADIETEYRPWTEEEREKIRSLMVAFYEDFVTKAAQGRKKSYDDIHALAQGRVWTGAEAHRNGLVDHLGGLDTAVSVAKQKAGIDKKQEVSLVMIPEPKGLLEALLERQEEADEITQVLFPREVRVMVQVVRLFRDQEIVARLPFDLAVR
jgi:protease-4